MSQRPALRMLTGLVEEAGPSAWFCSSCAAPAPEGAPRICRECEMGVVLEADAALAPGLGDAFLVLDASLNVGGVSDAAAAWLGRDEEELVNHPVTDFFEPAEVTKTAPKSIAGMLHGAGAAPSAMMVRPAGMFGVHVKARAGRCRPSGLLLVLPVPARR